VQLPRGYRLIARFNILFLYLFYFILMFGLYFKTGMDSVGIGRGTRREATIVSQARAR
jgi:hypothetical protein